MASYSICTQGITLKIHVTGAALLIVFSSETDSVSETEITDESREQRCYTMYYNVLEYL